MLALGLARLAASAEIVVDCAKPIGAIRPLHGVNNGPLDVGGTVDLSAYFREMSFPVVRLHDCHWPNPDVVDIHALFPNPSADPSLPESYDFVRTDAYLKAIVAAGGGRSQIIFRLGESIEHGPDKRRLAPPADPQRWAAICTGVVRHYNDGWAGGFHYGIRYWEIWNEPDNRPAMWTGSDDDFFRLYAATATALRKISPDLSIGGPGVGNVGAMKGESLEPSPFTLAFLERCRRDSLPLDFFSWHLYSADPSAFARQARAVRALLDRHALTKTQSLLTEWNYLPDDNWTPLLAGGQGVGRERFYHRIGGAEGAAFLAAALTDLQDCPLDGAAYYAGDTNPFGLFTRHAVPRKNFYAFKAFKAVADLPVRVAARIGEKGIARHRMTCLASRTKDADQPGRACVLVSNFDTRDEDGIDLVITGLPWTGPTSFEVLLLDGAYALRTVQSGSVDQRTTHIAQPLTAPSVCLVRLTQAQPEE